MYGWKVLEGLRGVTVPVLYRQAAESGDMFYDMFPICFRFHDMLPDLDGIGMFRGTI